MSLWRPETVRVGWESDRLSAVLCRAGSPGAARAVAVAGLDVAARLARLDELLAGGARVRRLEIVVSDHFARFFTFERPAGLRDLAELEATIAAAHEARFGGDVAPWRLAFDADAGRGTTGLACALPAPLVDGLREVAGRAGAPAASIRPYFAAVTGAHARALPSDAWLAAQADGQLTLALVTGGRWRALRSEAAAPDTPLETVIAREQLLQDALPEAIATVAFGDWNGRALPVGARVVGEAAWTGTAPAAGADYRMALAGGWR